MRNYDLGNRIYNLRKSKGLSQKELGELVGVSNKSVSKWENGTAIPKTDTLVKLAEVFDISSQELLQGKTDNRMTLSQLSSQASEMFLKEEIEKRENQDKLQEVTEQKRYLVIISSLFFSIFILLTILAALDIGITIEEGLKWYDILLDSFIGAYFFSSIFSGIVFVIRLAKKMPMWVLVIMCVLFPITILFVDMIGVVITPTYLIKSIKGIKEVKKNGQKRDS